MARMMGGRLALASVMFLRIRERASNRRGAIRRGMYCAGRRVSTLECVSDQRFFKSFRSASITFSVTSS
jgi:hypothetical protein